MEDKSKVSLLLESDVFEEEEKEIIKKEILKYIYLEEMIKEFSKKEEEIKLFFLNFDIEKNFLFLKKEFSKNFLLGYKRDDGYLLDLEFTHDTTILFKARNDFEPKFISKGKLIKLEEILERNFQTIYTNELKILQKKLQIKIDNDTLLKNISPNLKLYLMPSRECFSKKICRFNTYYKLQMEENQK